MEILGLEGEPSSAAIKKAYREQVKLWHPDRYSAGSAMRTLAEKNIQDANLAYAFLRQHTAPPPRTEAPPRATRTDPPPDRATQSPFVTRLWADGRRWLATLREFVPGILPGRLLNWLQHDPRNRFRPWYRYPDDSGKPEDRQSAVPFDRALQDAMQNREALKRLHRARRRSSEGDDADKITPVEAVARSRKTGHNASSDRR